MDVIQKVMDMIKATLRCTATSAAVPGEGPSKSGRPQTSASTRAAGLDATRSQRGNRAAMFIKTMNTIHEEGPVRARLGAETPAGSLRVWHRCGFFVPLICGCATKKVMVF